MSRAEAMLFSSTLQRLQDWPSGASGVAASGGRKMFRAAPEASQHPLLWRLTDGRAPSGDQILSQAEVMLFSPTLQRFQDITPLERILASRMAPCDKDGQANRPTKVYKQTGSHQRQETHRPTAGLTAPDRREPTNNFFLRTCS